MAIESWLSLSMFIPPYRFEVLQLTRVRSHRGEPQYWLLAVQGSEQKCRFAVARELAPYPRRRLRKRQGKDQAAIPVRESFHVPTLAGPGHYPVPHRPLPRQSHSKRPMLSQSRLPSFPLFPSQRGPPQLQRQFLR